MDSQLEVFLSSLNVICADWNTASNLTWGFSIKVERESVERAHDLWFDILDDNQYFPPKPGPFKCAAAYLVVAWAEVEFIFEPQEGAEALTEGQKRLWKSRFLFKSLSLVLKQLGISRDGKTIHLMKNWDTPTVHYRLDFLNFLRWTELPLDGPPNPPPPSHPTINMVRVNRLIMALALIIESCYYLAGNEPECDVMHKANIRPDDLLTDLQPDLFFDHDLGKSQSDDGSAG